MHAPLRLLAALAAALALAAQPTRADEPSTKVRVRLGAFQPGHRLNEADRFRVGPELEAGVGRALTPWLDAEASLGWAGTEVPRRTVLVFANPGNPAGQVVPLDVHSRLMLVPLTATARLRWPEGPVRPHLLAGAGLLYARRDDTFGTVSGWGPQLRAGAGLDWHRGDRVLVGLEGWWAWSRTDMRQAEVSQAIFSSPPTGPLRSDGLHLLATAGWRF